MMKKINYALRFTSAHSCLMAKWSAFPTFAIRYLAFAIFFIVIQTTSFVHSANAQSVGISIAVPDNSALLELQTTSQGLLPPRLTNTQMLGITSPATSDLVYNSTYVNYYYYTGSAWVPMIGTGWSLTGNSGTSPSTNFLGTVDAEDLVQQTKSVEHLRVYNGGGVGLTNTNNTAEALRFYEPSSSGSTYTAFKAGTQTTTAHYIWPLGGDGLPNQALVTDSLAGDLSWYTFATFGGTGSQLLWLRGSAPYSEYGDSAGNTSTSGSYAINAGENNIATGNNSSVWGVSGNGSGAAATIAGGSGNSAVAFATVHGGKNNTASATYGTTFGGLYNLTTSQYGTTLGGDSNKISATYSTIVSGAHNVSNASYQMIFGSSISVATADYVIFRPGTVGTKLGIGTVSPTQAVDVVGPVKFSGVLKPNNTGGSNGQYLLSAGASSPPTWGGASFSSNNWKLLGYSGTSPSTNYVGTADAQDFVLRTNGTERTRITSAGLVGIGTSTPAHKLSSIFPSTTDETAAGYGEASGATVNQAVGVWGTANTVASNTGTIGVLATGSGNTTAGNTNAALQISQGEFTMGRTTQAPSKGNVVEPAASGTLYSQQGPSGVIELSLVTNLTTTPPTAGVFQDLGTVTVNNQFFSSSSIILADVVQKVNSSSDPYTKNSLYKVDVESSTSGSAVFHLAMIPLVTDTNAYVSMDSIRLAYIVTNPGR